MPLNQQVLAPTNISNSGVAIPPPRITTLADGSYALTYVNVDLSWSVFDAQGQPIASGIFEAGHEFGPDITALTSGGFALAWWDSSFNHIYTGVVDELGVVSGAPDPVGNGFDSPDIAALANDRYVIAGNLINNEVFIAIRDAAGNDVLAQTNITNSPAPDGIPSIAVLADGN
jgi:hypothetical protein